MNNKLEINLDATALGHSACILDLYRTVIGDLDEEGKSIGGYRENAMGASLVYGIGVHKFIDVMFKTNGLYPKAMEHGLRMFNLPKRDDNRKMWLSDEKHFKTVCYNVWSNYIEQESLFELIELMQPCWMCKGSGVVFVNKDFPTQVSDCPNCKGQKSVLAPATEITFRIKYYEDDRYIVYLCGTIDKIGKFKGGCYSIGDWKTTSSWNTEGYFETYELSRQLRMYKLALRLMGLAQPDSALGKLGSTNVGVFIDAIFLSSKPNEVEVKRSEVFPISDNDIDAFQLTLDNKIQQLLQAINTGYLPKEGILNGACYKHFSDTPRYNCLFWDCCRHGGNVEKVLLKRNFKNVQYNPLNFNEV